MKLWILAAAAAFTLPAIASAADLPAYGSYGLKDGAGPAIASGGWFLDAGVGAGLTQGTSKGTQTTTAYTYTPSTYIPSSYTPESAAYGVYTPSSNVNGVYTPSSYTTTSADLGAYVPSSNVNGVYVPSTFTPSNSSEGTYKPSSLVNGVYTASSFTPSGNTTGVYTPSSLVNGVYTPSSYAVPANSVLSSRGSSYTPSVYTPSSNVARTVTTNVKSHLSSAGVLGEVRGGYHFGLGNGWYVGPAIGVGYAADSSNATYSAALEIGRKWGNAELKVGAGYAGQHASATPFSGASFSQDVGGAMVLAQGNLYVSNSTYLFVRGSGIAEGAFNASGNGYSYKVNQYDGNVLTGVGVRW